MTNSNGGDQRDKYQLSFNDGTGHSVNKGTFSLTEASKEMDRLIAKSNGLLTERSFRMEQVFETEEDFQVSTREEPTEEEIKVRDFEFKKMAEQDKLEREYIYHEGY